MKTLLGVLSVGALTGLLVSAFSATPAAPAAAAAAETYAIDNGHSSVIFHTKHIGVSESYGRFNKIVADKSKLVLDGDKSSILLVIDAASVDTNLPDRDQHLRSPDFFNVKEFPEIVFESKKVKASGKEFTVEGELTFLGVTKTISAKAHQTGTGEMRGQSLSGFLAEFTLDMNDYGVAFLKQNAGALGPEVHLTVSLECARK